MGRVLAASIQSPFLKQTFKGLFAFSNAESLALIAQLIEQGQLTPAIDAVYPLEQAAEAIRRIGQGGVLGKIVLSVAAV